MPVAAAPPRFLGGPSRRLKLSWVVSSDDRGVSTCEVGGHAAARSERVIEGTQVGNGEVAVLVAWSPAGIGCLQEGKRRYFRARRLAKVGGGGTCLPSSALAEVVAANMNRPWYLGELHRFDGQLMTCVLDDAIDDEHRGVA